MDIAYGQTSLVVFSTRSIFDSEIGELSIAPRELSDAKSILGLDGQNCPPEIATYVHGIRADEHEATEEFGRMSYLLKPTEMTLPLLISVGIQVLRKRRLVGVRQNK